VQFLSLTAISLISKVGAVLMKKQLTAKLSQIFYKPSKVVDGKRISTSLESFDKEIGSAMDDVFRTEKKKKQ